jgi:hypothetical protein
VGAERSRTRMQARCARNRSAYPCNQISAGVISCPRKLLRPITGTRQRMHAPSALLLLFAFAMAGLSADQALAEIVVRIELTRQRMDVAVDGIPYATWPVSTARRGYRTPEGTYTPYWLDRMHYSKLYDYTPMPYSIFFLRGYAIHGTTEIRSLGRAVSHGCVRLRTSNAKLLFELVSGHGLHNTSITIIP